MKAHLANPELLAPLENETLDKWLVVLLIGILVAMLVTLARRVNPADLTYTPSDDEIPTIVLEGP